MVKVKKPKVKLFVPGYYDHTLPHCMEPENKMRDMCVPDESYTVRELMVRFTNGMTIPNLGGSYPETDTEDFDAPDLEKLRDADIVDRQEYADMLKAEVNAYVSKRKAAVAKAKADEKKAAEQAAQKADEERSDKGAQPAATKLPDERLLAPPA